ncbi:MAG: hypothetical protein GIW98_00740 [Candidatus Eremiobacteraeota bacterium]|nr:hypothetical protein [Candidatus Eremiobacteraeota bacterium]
MRWIQEVEKAQTRAARIDTFVTSLQEKKLRA